MTETNTNMKTMTKTNALRKHLQRAILETCNLWDIWSDWWGNMTWPTKKTKTMTKTSTFREHLQRAILNNCDLWDIWSVLWGETILLSWCGQCDVLLQSNFITKYTHFLWRFFEPFKGIGLNSRVGGSRRCHQVTGDFYTVISSKRVNLST